MADNLSTLYLCKDVPFNNTYETTVDFTGQTEAEAREKQLAFFNSYAYNQTEIETTYLRLNRPIYVEYKLDDLFGVNYCYARNATTGKWYFYFIVDKQYVNENTTVLSLEMDVFQTYMFDYTLGECFVGREHQDRFKTTTSFNYNLEPENVEIGNEYKTNRVLNVMSSSDTWVQKITYAYLWISTNQWTVDKIGTGTIKPLSGQDHGTNINGIPSGLYCLVLPITPTANKPIVGPNVTIEGVTYTTYYDNIASGTLDYYNTSAYLTRYIGNSSVVGVSISQYPPAGVDVDPDTGYLSYSNSECIPITLDQPAQIKRALLITNSSTTFKYASLVNRNSLDPTNNKLLFSTNTANLNKDTAKDIKYEPKLLTYPYRKYSIVVGDKTKLLKPELLASEYILYYKSPFNVGGTLIVPYGYAGQELGYGGECIVPSMNNLNMLSSPYKDFVQSKANSFYTGLLVSTAEGALKTGMAAYNKEAQSAITSGVNTVGNIANKLAQVQDIYQAAPTISKTGDDFGINLFYGPYSNGYILDQEILPQFKERLFNYLYRYGYSCNNFKTPNLKSRYWFNYIEMPDVTFTANKVDSDYVDQLKAIYQKGITIWHFRGTTSDITTYKSSNLLQYGKENVEMSVINNSL